MYIYPNQQEGELSEEDEDRLLHKARETLRASSGVVDKKSTTKKSSGKSSESVSKSKNKLDRASNTRNKKDTVSPSGREKLTK